jgi:lipid II isoglutaminyl synthase (glutamine-hydrolysing)
VPSERIEVVAELERALDRGLELTTPGGELVVLPTYTAMLALRRIAVARGLARPYWEEAA